MRRLHKILILMVTIIFIGGLSLSFAQNVATSRTDYKKLAEEGYKNAKQTRDIVAGVLKKLEPTLKDASKLKKGEVEDAKYWFNKADKLLQDCKKRMDAGKYDKSLVIDLNQSWQWFIKAGSAAVRATMME